MALRARLVAPPPKPKVAWPFHILNWAAMPSSILFVGDRRMEAETYLSSGFGFRLAIESKHSRWLPLKEIAKVWKPGRAKGIIVAPEFGVAFLAATQVFDIRPIARKYVSANHTKDADLCMSREGQIVVTCSGSVGRSTVLSAAHSGMMISNDLLRVDAIDEKDKGWIYAYLRASQVRAMTTSAQYGHIIKHLETSHLEELPIPKVDRSTASDFNRRLNRILELRNDGHRLTLEAEAHFEKALGPLKINNWGEQGFSVKASSAFLSERRRLDASFYNPGSIAIHRHLAKHGKGFTTVREAGYEIWVPGRYRRISAEDGVVYRDSADLLEVSPDLTKRFADCRFGDEFHGRVKSGWILIPSSGQVYGIIGTAILATGALDNQVVSNHVIRVAPSRNPSIHAGYLIIAMSHLKLGRPLIKSLAFGSSVPEIDSKDVANFEVVRLGSTEESVIADLAEGSAKAHAEADLLERAIAQDASTIIDRVITL
ncbi:MAG: hypothetical protein HY787_18690 [Deltaproteobacteria bacterium]|nr:hypothetical protein [Deltaproteobacteria bacterium]